MAPPITMFTEQGYDLQFGTNVLGPYHLVMSSFPFTYITRLNATTTTLTGHFHLRALLLPALLRASTAAYKSRIVITSSSAAYITNEIKWDTLDLNSKAEGAEGKSAKERKKMGPMGLYYQSKFVSLSLLNWIAYILYYRNH